MSLRSGKEAPRLGAVAVGLVMAFLAPGAHAQASGAFAGLEGAWSGTGTITLSSGASERIRCRAAYRVAENGQNLTQNLRCASDSYNFDLRSSVRYEGGAISGNWSETTRNASGSISGRAGGGEIQASVRGASFSAGLSLATRGDRQSVSIRSQGSELSQVSIVLSRVR
jgi:hypothetical protein